MAAVGFGDSGFELLRSMATGPGRRLRATDPPVGTFLPASEVGELSEQLRVAVLGTPLELSRRGVATCENRDETCSTVGALQVFDFPFRVDEALTAFNLLTVAGDPAVSSTLISPTGQQLDLRGSESGTFDNGVQFGVTQVTDTIHQVSATLPEGRADWAGQWRVRFRTDDAAKAQQVQNRASIYAFGSLQARLRDGGPPLRRGRASPFVVELVGATGQPKSDGAFTAGSELVLSDAAGAALATPAVAPDGSFPFTYDVPMDAPDSLTFEARVRPQVQLADDLPAIELPEWRGMLAPISVRDLPGFPLVDAPGSLGELSKDRMRATTTMGVDASGPEAGGCVSLMELQVTDTPEGTVGTPVLELLDGDRVVTPEDECARRCPRASMARSRWLYRSTGNSSGSRRASSAASWSCARPALPTPRSPRSSSTRWAPASIPNVVISEEPWTFLLLLLAALVGPLTLLYGYNHFVLARFVGRPGVMADVDVSLRGTDVSRRDTAALEGPFSLSADDVSVTGLGADTSRRKVTLPGVTFASRGSAKPVRRGRRARRRRHELPGGLAARIDATAPR